MNVTNKRKEKSILFIGNEREHLAYGVSWNNSQGENIKAYKYKWSQLGAVSVGFRVFFD